ncbi:MAG: hypothetical protein EPGJADBJ_02312 [Saprospiraceae bacterium]|nr:hypothetical protein [Saprospiraceae bacterium]
MKNLLLLAFAFFAASASAQATFNLYPDTVSVTVDLGAEEIGAYNNITNLTGSDIVIRWERTINIIDPDTLFTRVCDPIQCYAEFVDTKTFTLPANSTAPMSVHLYKAQGQNASAFVQLKYTDLAQPDAHQYSYYIFNSAPSGTNDVLPAANVKLYPNPVVESFSLDNAGEVSRIRVFSTDGRQVAVFNASAGQTYSLASQAAGTYVVALESKSGKIFQAIGIRKN